MLGEMLLFGEIYENATIGIIILIINVKQNEAKCLHPNSYHLNVCWHGQANQQTNKQTNGGKI